MCSKMSGVAYSYSCILLLIYLSTIVRVVSGNKIGNYPYRVTKEYDVIYTIPDDVKENSSNAITGKLSALAETTTSANAREFVSNCETQYPEVSNLSDINGVYRLCKLNTTGSGLDDLSTMGGVPLTHYSLLFAAVAATLSSVIFVFGILGNILVVMVIVRIHSMHTTTNCYLLSLAVADSLVLLSATLPSIPEPFFRVDEWPYGRVMCSLLIFLQYLGVDSSSLSITAFTIERYIAICHPMKAQTMCTVSRAKRIIAAIWIFTILYCAPWLGLTELQKVSLPKNEYIIKCHFRLARSSYLVWYMIDLILYYFIPLIIATVLYLLIGRILYLSRALRKTDHTSQRRSPKKPDKRRADSRVQVVRMLVVVVVAFATLWMPYRVMVVYNSFAQKKYMDMWFLLFARTMVYVNCAINPVLYNIMSVKFKRAFRNHLTCWFRHSSLPSQNYSDDPTDQWGPKRKQQQQQRYLLSNNGSDRRHHTMGNSANLHHQQQQKQQQQQQPYSRQSCGSVDSLSQTTRVSKQYVFHSLDTAEQAV